MITRTEQRGTTFVFTTPIEPDCNGTVVALQYCYQGRERDLDNKRIREVFKLLHLSRSGSLVRVEDRLEVETISHQSICTIFPEDDDDTICCNNVTLEADQFLIPPSNYTFGVVLSGSSSARLLAFSDTNTEYQYPHYQTYPAGTAGPSIGQTFELNDQDLLLTNGLMILQFLTGIHSN